MRSPTDASIVPWTTRVFRPWLVASVFGLALGLTLLNVETPESPSSYTEPAPRAAVYDEPAVSLVVVPSVEATVVSEPPLTPLVGLVDGAASASPPVLE
ncbi:MAG: hypothetical protein H7067_20265 [Burkholderiales bacterium]|nr:hypothetical protein [Opitutaceae bacterium]